MQELSIAKWGELDDRKPTGALVSNVDLVIVKYDENHSVFYGRCLHRGAMLSDGEVNGDSLVCSLHSWDYGLQTGVSQYNSKQRLHKFSSWIKDGSVMIDVDEILLWEKDNPQPYDRSAYQGAYQDKHNFPLEPHVGIIRRLAAEGLSELGHHGPVGAMGVPRMDLPLWEDIQFVTAQLATKPLQDDVPVGSNMVIGPNAKKPLELDIPIFVSDMSFGALSAEAKISLSKGAELSGTGICSGEGGMLPEEQEANSRYFYELASGFFGWSMEKVKKCQAFHFKLGQGAKTGTGGHLPGHKVSPEIAEVRGLEPGQDAISPPTFERFTTAADFAEFAQEVREETGGIPIGVKMSAQHIEADLDKAFEIGVDYVILDGRGGGTGAAPTLFRDNISVPTIPALARARRHLDASGKSDITLIITGGLRIHSDFCKALALGADAIATSNSALQAIGCLGMRACHTNACPVGIATQREDLRSRLIIDEAAKNLNRFFEATVELMGVMARACGHDHLNKFCRDDLTAWKPEMQEVLGKN